MTVHLLSIVYLFHQTVYTEIADRLLHRIDHDNKQCVNFVNKLDQFCEFLHIALCIMIHFVVLYMTFMLEKLLRHPASLSHTGAFESSFRSLFSESWHAPNWLIVCSPRRIITLL